MGQPPRRAALRRNNINILDGLLKIADPIGTIHRALHAVRLAEIEGFFHCRTRAERDHRAIRRPGQPAADSLFEVRQLLRFAAIHWHDKNLRLLRTIRHKGEAFAIRRPGRAAGAAAAQGHLTGRAAGQ